VDKNVYAATLFFMPAATVRISPRGHRILSQLSAASNSSMPDILEEALENYRRQKFLEQAAAAYEALSGDSPAFAAYQKDLASMEGTLVDGLDKLA
jgi:hypothetical protein